MTDDAQTLLEAASRAAEQAYAPYTKEKKGAALLAADGSVFVAANVESAAWPASVCAEASALSSAIAAGKTEFLMLCPLPNRFPCGACLQLFREFPLRLTFVSKESAGAIVSKTLE